MCSKHISRERRLAAHGAARSAAPPEGARRPARAARAAPGTRSSATGDRGHTDLRPGCRGLHKEGHRDDRARALFAGISCVSRLRPVLLCPYLCTSEGRLRFDRLDARTAWYFGSVLLRHVRRLDRACCCKSGDWRFGFDWFDVV